MSRTPDHLLTYILRLNRTKQEASSPGWLAIERRQATRYDLRLPVELLRKGLEKTCERGETRNLSSKGILFEINTPARPGDLVEFVVTLPTGSRSKQVYLHCSGRVVRCDKDTQIAATLERYEFFRARAAKGGI